MSSGIFDVVIVGGGPAGLSAALMLGRCRRRVLVCDLGEPRNRWSRALHGYLTRDGIPPLELTCIARRELVQYEIETRVVRVVDAARTEDGFRVQFSDGQHEQSRFLLLATGVVDAIPDVNGFSACYGRSVFHCPYCDAWEWRDRRLTVMGSSSEIVRLGLALKTWSRDIVLCTNGAPIGRAVRRRLKTHGIGIRTAPIDAIEHDEGLLKTIRFRGDEPPLERDALFFQTVQAPQSTLAVKLGCALTRHGTVKTGTLSDTKVPGLFVAGDLSRDAQLVVVAAAEGAKAGIAINQALQRQERQL